MQISVSTFCCCIDNGLSQQNRLRRHVVGMAERKEKLSYPLIILKSDNFNRTKGILLYSTA